MTATTPVSLTIDVPQTKIDAVLDRVRSYRWFSVPRITTDFGVSPEFMKQLTHYWTTEYEWRRHEQAPSLDFSSGWALIRFDCRLAFVDCFPSSVRV